MKTSGKSTGFLVGIDVGTSGTKVTVFSTSGEPVTSHTSEYPLYQPHNGWAEQEPHDWWNAAVDGLRAVIAEVGSSGILGVGLSGQMHGLVMLGKDNELLDRAIIWCDQRTARECSEIERKVGKDRLMSITKSPALTGFTASKLLWVRNNKPEVYERIKRILLPKDYIRFMLTGEAGIDASDASGTQLLDIEKRRWSDEVLDALGIDRSFLPAVPESCELTGKITKRVSELTGLPVGTPVAAGAGDNAASAIGCGVIGDGDAFTTVGTSGVVFAHCRQPLSDPLGRIHSFCAAVPGEYHVMGVTQAAGLSLRWLRDNICTEERAEAKKENTDIYNILTKKAAYSPIGANRLIYTPYLMGERTPHLDADARGAFVGLSAMHDKGDLIRSVLEGVTYSLYDCLSVIRERGIDVKLSAVCGGGSRSPFWRQMISDVFGIPVSLMSSNEGASLGAALLAGVASGVYGSVAEACGEAVKVADVLSPDMEKHAEYGRVYEIYKEIYPALSGIYKKLPTI